LIYRPLLAFGPPALCAWFGWPTAVRVVRCYCIFGGLLLVPPLTATNFAEVRAEMPVWLLLMPVALLGMQSMIEGGSGIAHPASINNLETHSTLNSVKAFVEGKGEVDPCRCCAPDGRVDDQFDRGALS
jgi:hypothetical protein